MIEKEVRDKVARLLALVCNESTDPESHEFVLKKLTRMAINGTLPAGSRGSRPSSQQVKTTVNAATTPSGKEPHSYPAVEKKHLDAKGHDVEEIDESRRKENWIAP